MAAGRSDKGQPRLYGIKLGGEGDVTATHRAWRREDTGTFVPTPAEYKGRIYLLRDRGEIDCLDPATGQTLWKDALPKASSSYYASPVIAAGNLYATREDGVVYVAQVEGKFQMLAESNMGGAGDRFTCARLESSPDSGRTTPLLHRREMRTLRSRARFS